MRNALRTAVLLLPAAALLTFGGTAQGGGSRQAAIATIKQFVTGASQAVGAPGVKIKITKSQADSDLAKFTEYVPQGYSLTTSASVGTQLGTAAATVFARDLSAIVPVTGTVSVANPADFAAAATACTGTATHTAIWALNLQAAGTPLTVPAFIDTITTPPLNAIASASIVFCLPPSDIPAGTPGRATLGASVITAEFTTSAIANPPSPGEYRWRGTATPYQTANGKVDAASTVEVQALVELPTTLSLKAKASKSTKKGVENVAFNGSLLADLKGVNGATVDVFKGSTPTGVRKFKTLSTDSNGAFSGTFAVLQHKTATSVYLLAKGATTDQDLGSAACQATFVPPASPFPIPCIDATVSAVAVTSSTVKVTIPAAPKPKKKK